MKSNIDSPQTINQGQEVDLIEIFKAVWLGRKLVFFVTIIFVIIGLAYALLATPYYKANISIYSSYKGNSRSFGFLQMFSKIPSGNSSDDQVIFNIPDIVRSRSFCEKLVRHKWNIVLQDTIYFMDLRNYFNLINEVETPKNIKTEKEQISWEQRQYNRYAIMLSQRFNTEINEESGLIVISIETTNAGLSRDILNYTGELLVNYLNEIKSKKSKKSRMYLEKRVSIAKYDLQTIEDTLNNFMKKNRNYLNSPDLQLEFSRLKRKLEVKQEVYLTLVKQKELALIEENKVSDGIEILDSSISPENAYKPRKKIILVVSSFLGFILSSFIIVVQNFIYNHRNKGA